MEDEVVIEVYNREGKYEGLLLDSIYKPWKTTFKKAKAYVSIIDERYRERYKVVRRK